MAEILITGSTGSLGNLLVKRLKSNNHNVITTVDLKSRIEADGYFEGIKSPENIDVLYHLAAKSLVPESWKSPDEFIQTNVAGTSKVLEFCRINRIKLVFISSYVYGIPKYLPIDEKHPVSALNPYALSKIICEQLCTFYGKNFDLEYTIVRPFNLYGTLDNPTLLIPEIIHQILNKSQIIVKDLTPKRDYIHVDDVVDFLSLLTGEMKNEIYNLGSGKSLSVKEIVDECQNIFGTDLKVVSSEKSRKNEIPETIADSQKAKKEYNWEPQRSFETAIKSIKEQLSAESKMKKS